VTEPPADGAEAQMATADGARWRGHTHKQLYAMIHDGPGAGASAEPARRWQEIASNLSEIGQDLRKTLEQTGAAWTGRAAGGAYDRLVLTATWATETGESAAQMRTAVENQAEYLAKARADMPPPEDPPATQPDPTVVPAVQVAQAQTDLEAPESSSSSAEERAFEVMTAYEQSTLANTTAMAAFAPPLALFRRDEVKRGGGLNAQVTRPSGLDDMPKGRHDDHRPRHHGGHNWSSNTSGSSTPWHEQGPRGLPAAQTSPAPGGGPSAFTAGAVPPRRESDQERTSKPAAPATNNTVGASPSSNPTQPKAGVPSMALPQDLQQAAAAQQAAATAQAQAGAPMAPATAGPTGVGQHDRMAMRRFGMEAIGSNQWFGDTEEPVVGESPKRRRDFREIEEVTETVSVLDEEHRLPPNVIGDGPSGR